VLVLPRRGDRLQRTRCARNDAVGGEGRRLQSRVTGGVESQRSPSGGPPSDPQAAGQPGETGLVACGIRLLRVAETGIGRYQAAHVVVDQEIKIVALDAV